MLPDNTHSSIAFGANYLAPDDRVTTPLVDWERGGIALNDASQGLLVRNWRCWLNYIDVMLQAEGGSPVLLFQEVGITELAFCFDQNMRYSVAFVQAGVLKLRWYDSSVGAFVTSVFDEAVNPKLALDDKRATQIAQSDMILAYIRGSTLYYRQQRDRFLVERVLRTDLYPNTKLKNIGMSKNLRLQFELV